MIRKCWAARICGASHPIRRRPGFGIRRPRNSVQPTQGGVSDSCNSKLLQTSAEDPMRHLFGMALLAMTMAFSSTAGRAAETEYDPAKVSESLKAIFQFGSV